MSYTQVVTAILDHGTLTQVDPETMKRLETAADDYEQAPARLKAAILVAARNGEKASDITRAIRHSYTYEYVGRLIRADRRDNPDAYPAPPSKPSGDPRPDGA
jgi:hypothetical protein